MGPEGWEYGVDDGATMRELIPMTYNKEMERCRYPKRGDAGKKNGKEAMLPLENLGEATEGKKWEDA